MYQWIELALLGTLVAHLFMQPQLQPQPVWRFIAAGLYLLLVVLRVIGSHSA